MAQSRLPRRLSQYTHASTHGHSHARTYVHARAGGDGTKADQCGRGGRRLSAAQRRCRACVCACNTDAVRACARVRVHICVRVHARVHARACVSVWARATACVPVCVLACAARRCVRAGGRMLILLQGPAVSCVAVGDEWRSHTNGLQQKGQNSFSSHRSHAEAAPASC